MSGAPKKMPKRIGARIIRAEHRWRKLRVEPLEVGGDRGAVAVRGAGDDHGVVDVEQMRPGDGERYEDPQDPERGDGRRRCAAGARRAKSWRHRGHREGILADRTLAHVGEHEVLEVDRLDDPARARRPVRRFEPRAVAGGR